MSNQMDERLSTERALRESERMLQTLMGNIPGMAFRCVPSPPWCFEYASPGARELSGYEPEDFYADGCITWAALMHADDVERVTREAELAFAEKRQLTVSYRIRTRAGEQRWVWDRSVGIYDGDGALIALEGFVTDITEQKKRDEEAAKRVEFEQQLIGIVSHDLRNPLHAILLAAATMLRREDLDPGIVKNLLRVQSAGERAARMIRDLLDFTQARLGGGIHIDRKRVSLREIVQQVVEEAETAHPEREIRVRHEDDGEGCWDPDRLAQALGNLLANAIRYSAQGSPVSIRTARDAASVLLEVHNFGDPIPPEIAANLFQPMQRGVTREDKLTRSVGLGLYIVDLIVRGHDGAVTVDSGSQGTTFSVRLPISTPPVDTPPEALARRVGTVREGA